MSIRKQTFIIISSACVILIASLFASSRIILLGNVVKREQEAVGQNVELALKMVQKEIASLDAISMDWAYWDDTYEFIENRNGRYIESNLTDSTIANLKLNFMLFVNSSPRIIYEKFYDLNRGNATEFPEDLKQYIMTNGNIIDHKDPDHLTSGIVSLESGTMMISACPITKTDKDGSIKGTLIVGKYLSSGYVKELEEMTNSKITLMAAKDIAAYPDLDGIFLSGADKEQIKVKSINGDMIEGYALIKDVNGKSALAVKLEMERLIYKQGYKAFKVFTISFFICVMISITIILLIMQKTFVTRLENLNVFINRWSLDKEISERVSIAGNDEISNLAGAINGMLDKIERTNGKLRYLSFHDTLTGLYNRAFYEEELRRLDVGRQLPISIIIGDVNGLKLANDAFGHKEGDKLLVTMGKIIEESCRTEDIVARLGGDEFIILLPKTGEDKALEICERIRKRCMEVEGNIVKPSIALGVSTKSKPEMDMQKVLDEAEDRMYKNKLAEEKSARHSVIASMQRALFETDYETEEHAKRLQCLALRMGKALNLPDNQLDELSLLAMLHDIGKIAIPKEILTKPGKLYPEEWEIIKEHPEIGYRIAVSSYELTSIADAILAHHEKWDGSGYPKGLKGENIPFISRIISIIDAYDVMTHERPYKKAYSTEEAVNELRRCAGTHFDAELVEAFINMISQPPVCDDDFNNEILKI